MFHCIVVHTPKVVLTWKQMIILKVGYLDATFKKWICPAKFWLVLYSSPVCVLRMYWIRFHQGRNMQKLRQGRSEAIDPSSLWEPERASRGDWHDPRAAGFLPRRTKPTNKYLAAGGSNFCWLLHRFVLQLLPSDYPHSFQDFPEKKKKKTIFSPKNQGKCFKLFCFVLFLPLGFLSLNPFKSY